MKEVTVHYYAILREQCGKNHEVIQTEADTPEILYQELKTKYNFTLSAEILKVAVNDSFADWSAPLSQGDSLIFIPPVAGG